MDCHRNAFYRFRFHASLSRGQLRHPHDAAVPLTDRVHPGARKRHTRLYSTPTASHLVHASCQHVPLVLPALASRASSTSLRRVNVSMGEPTASYVAVRAAFFTSGRALVYVIAPSFGLLLISLLDAPLAVLIFGPALGR
jgi:hypothetical protein